MYIDADLFNYKLSLYEQYFIENQDFSARQTILQVMEELKDAPAACVVDEQLFRKAFITILRISREPEYAEIIANEYLKDFCSGME